MKAERLKMRKDVWTRTLFSVSQWGVYMGRQVMYYLESDLPLCLIRAWLREGVTGGFFPRVRTSAQEWRWTCDLHTELGQYLHTLNAKCRKCVTLLCWHVHGQVMLSVHLPNNTLAHYIIGQLWDNLQSLWSCFKHMSICNVSRELCFSQSLIKVETQSGVLLQCSANEP